MWKVASGSSPAYRVWFGLLRTTRDARGLGVRRDAIEPVILPEEAAQNRLSTRWMTPTSCPSNVRYLDPTELAEVLGLSVRTIILRAKHRPWLLPPRAELYERELLRWRQDIVALWLRPCEQVR